MKWSMDPEGARAVVLAIGIVETIAKGEVEIGFDASVVRHDLAYGAYDQAALAAFFASGAAGVAVAAVYADNIADANCASWRAVPATRAPGPSPSPTTPESTP